MNKLCCTLSPSLICRACGLEMCDPCVRQSLHAALDVAYAQRRSTNEVGPLFHEKGECSKGANTFRITPEGVYIYTNSYEPIQS